MNTPTYLLVAALGVVLTSCPSPAQPAESDNAATYYRKAFEVLPDDKDPNWQILQHPDAVHLNETAVEFIGRHESTFELLRKGAACGRCDWGVDLKQGSAAPLPHLNGARTISNLTRLRARLLFQQRRHAEAMEDVAALLVLSRHVGSDPFIAAKLIEAGVADSAVAAAAPGVGALPPEAARALMEKMDRLPDSQPPAEVVRREGELMAAEARRSAAESAAAGEIARLFEEAARHLALPFDQSFAPMQKWEAKRQAASPAVQKRVPALGTYRLSLAAAETRVRMLYVAAAIRVEGPRARFRYHEPFVKGPFDYRGVPGGFELESKLVVKNVPVKLTCRPSGDELPF